MHLQCAVLSSSVCQTGMMSTGVFVNPSTPLRSLEVPVRVQGSEAPHGATVPVRRDSLL